MRNIKNNASKQFYIQEQDDYLEKMCILDEAIKNIELSSNDFDKKKTSEFELNLETLIYDLKNQGVIDDGFIFVLRLMPISLRAKKLRNYLSRLASINLFRHNIDDACFYNSKSLIAADIQSNYNKAKRNEVRYKDECIDILRREKIKLMRKVNK